MNTLQIQFDQMLQRGIIPCLEYPILLNGEKDWLLVDIQCQEKGLQFSFDSNGLKNWFGGEVVQINTNRYFLPFDSYESGSNDSDHLDYYLQAIDENIQVGFIDANSLYDLDQE